MSNKSGILKLKSKYDVSARTLDFLVFGYHCKLYRDDKKASELDREGHLIPAPYEPKDLISRYDVRATLSDITPYEASSNSYLNRLDGLSPAEQQAEQLAEEERYYSLYKNEVEEEMYKEEHEKRQETSGYTQVSFSYDDEVKEIGPKVSADVQENEENDDTPFSPTEDLNLPSEMEYPNTVKLNQIIEKTAKFISSQGPQMEILLKAKQSSNPQFDFLNHNGQYNPYYKHILAMMKNNTYPWQNDKISEKSSDDNENSSNTNDSNIQEESTPFPAIIIPKLQYKPSADCAYTQLISKITKAPISELERKNEEEEKKKQIVNSDSSKIVSGSLGLVANYSSESESEEDTIEEYKGPLPPSDIQIVIDKTAIYVAKNGPEFEQKLMFKQDSRFQFLREDNEFHLYYKMKVKSYQPSMQFTNGSNTVPNTISAISSTVEIPKKEEIIVPKPPSLPVSFSIKAKEERAPLKSNMVNSDDEIKDDNCQKVPEAPSPPRITSVEEELERQVDIITAEREEKLAKERLNDKLLNAAREKLGMLPKEKMLQIERKKKAMMFINQIKGSNGSSSNGSNKREDDVINLTQCEDDSNDSVSVKSTTISEKSRKNSSSRSSRSTSRSLSSTSRSSDGSPKRKRSKKSKRKTSRKYRRSRSRSRSKSRSRYKHSKRW